MEARLGPAVVALQLQHHRHPLVLDHPGAAGVVEGEAVHQFVGAVAGGEQVGGMDGRFIDGNWQVNAAVSRIGDRAADGCGGGGAVKLVADHPWLDAGICVGGIKLEGGVNRRVVYLRCEVSSECVKLRRIEADAGGP